MSTKIKHRNKVSTENMKKLVFVICYSCLPKKLVYNWLHEIVFYDS